ncbi:hypothetical protein FQA39_LY05604 [Lamprigera yunnana]|nr:hypothetical protein FQA39_LY05604 [Lamprigera yunnana]
MCDMLDDMRLISLNAEGVNDNRFKTRLRFDSKYWSRIGLGSAALSEVTLNSHSNETRLFCVQAKTLGKISQKKVSKIIKRHKKDTNEFIRINDIAVEHFTKLYGKAEEDYNENNEPNSDILQISEEEINLRIRTGRYRAQIEERLDCNVLLVGSDLFNVVCEPLTCKASQDDSEPVKGQIIISLLSRDGPCRGTPLAVVGPLGELRGPGSRDESPQETDLPPGWEDRRTPNGRFKNRSAVRSNNNNINSNLSNNHSIDNNSVNNNTDEVQSLAVSKPSSSTSQVTHSVNSERDQNNPLRVTALSLNSPNSLGQAETKTHTRHPHSGNTHHRSIRADSRTNFSYENSPNVHDIGFIQIYPEQHVKLTLECSVNINFSTSIWLKDGQIVQTILKDNINNKRVSGHRFLVDSVGNLLIDNVRLEDDGRWQCEAEDALGFVVTGKQIQLTVLGE